MGVETVYQCDGCGFESIDKRDFNLIAFMSQSHKYSGQMFPRVCLCENCTDDFVEEYGLKKYIRDYEDPNFPLDAM